MESENYQVLAWVLPAGGGWRQSNSYLTESVIGEGLVGVTHNRSGSLYVESGFLVCYGDLIQDSKIYDIAWVRAREMPMGREIGERVWQSDDTPYFYWQTVEPRREPVGYSYSVDSFPDDEIDTSVAFCDFSTLPLSEGKHVFHVKAQNSAGSWGEEGTFEIWIDKTAPYVKEISPSSGSLLNERDIPIDISFGDNLSGVDFDSVEFYLDGTKLGLDCDKDTGVCSYSNVLPVGQITVRVTVRDNAGNVMPDYMWSFVVDVTGPVGDIKINHDAPITYSTRVTLSLSAEDDLTSVKFMRIGNTRHLCLSSEWIPFSSEIEWMLTPSNGEKNVFVQFMDEAGNVSIVYSDSILLQILAPDTIITSGPSGVVEQREAYFRYTASEEDCYFSYRLDDGDWSQWTGEDSVLLVGLSDGRHIFSVRAAKDLNGNHTIDEDEIDPTPAQRVWFVGKIGRVRKDVRVALWRVE